MYAQHAHALVPGIFLYTHVEGETEREKSRYPRQFSRPFCKQRE